MMTEDILDYVVENERVCPKPDKWNELWQMLPDKQRVGNGWNGPIYSSGRYWH